MAVSLSLNQHLTLYNGVISPPMYLSFDSANPLEVATELKAILTGIAQISQEGEFARSELITQVVEANADKDFPEDEVADLDPSDRATSLGEARKAQALARQIAGGAEATVFSRFIYRVAEYVANSAGGGLLGTGDELSSEEQDYLDQLQNALSL